MKLAQKNKISSLKPEKCSQPCDVDTGICNNNVNQCLSDLEAQIGLVGLHMDEIVEKINTVLIPPDTEFTKELKECIRPNEISPLSNRILNISEQVKLIIRFQEHILSRVNL